jgi:hypothetical protein
MMSVSGVRSDPFGKRFRLARKKEGNVNDQQLKRPWKTARNKSTQGQPRFLGWDSRAITYNWLDFRPKRAG